MKDIPRMEGLRFKLCADSMRGDYIGDWRPRLNRIDLYAELPEVNLCLVGVHELVEWIINALRGAPDCESEEYDQTRDGWVNALAHNTAETVEKMICDVGGVSFDAHQKLCGKLSRQRRAALRARRDAPTSTG